MPEPGHVSATIRPTVREQVRAAIARAWVSAIDSGALPPLPTDAPRPAIEVERPAEAVHGDFASNLAMKLARPYRMAPLAIAGALANELRRGRQRADQTPIATAGPPRPGS
jgi:arginyl-tRNA synthetase